MTAECEREYTKSSSAGHWAGDSRPLPGSSCFVFQRDAYATARGPFAGPIRLPIEDRARDFIVGMNDIVTIPRTHSHKLCLQIPAILM